MTTPYSMHIYDEVTSTQDVAAGAYDGTPQVVAAGRQTAGRGRRHTGWETAPRALAVSAVFEPDWPAASWPLIPLIAGLSAAEILGPVIRLKWPNDLLIDDEKVGGLLVEASGTRVVVGCGVNLWWPEPPPGRGGLYAADPGPDRYREVARQWADHLFAALKGRPETWPRDRYLERCSTIGRTINWEPQGVGRAVDVDETGALVVATDSGVQRLIAGEVHHVRPPT
ncbi:MAG: biotin--[acetyl-CoA-carboxylase] ligase [Actinomycetota bacterium]